MVFFPLSFQKLLFRISGLFKSLVRMGSIPDSVYLLGRDEAETTRYVCYATFYMLRGHLHRGTLFIFYLSIRALQVIAITSNSCHICPGAFYDSPSPSPRATSCKAVLTLNSLNNQHRFLVQLSDLIHPSIPRNITAVADIGTGTGYVNSP